jgi:MinD superfamily P-loop ATPase
MSGPGRWSTLRRWTLATRGYCQTCRGQTSQSAIHELKPQDDLHIITTECSGCGSTTSVQRLPLVESDAR